MEAMLGISLYCYPYLKLAKMLCLSYDLFCVLFSIMGEEEGRIGSAAKQEWWGEEMAQTMFTHLNKWINNKKEHNRWSDF
jgi:hypothetical protein